MASQRLTPERRRQLSRDAMLDAAEEIFAKKGVDGASMEEIATEAGFSRAGIYAKFGNKDDLLVAVLDRHIARQIEEFSSLGQPSSAAAGAADAAKVFRRTVRLDVVPLEVELRANALRNPVVRQRLVDADRRVSEKMTALIEQQVDHNELRIPARDLADIGRAAVIGLLQYAAVDDEEAARYERLVETVFRLLAMAVDARTGSPRDDASQ